jgi:hypothetical protein
MSCVICLGANATSTLCVRCRCVYHPACLIELIKRTNNLKCPGCRASFTRPPPTQPPGGSPQVNNAILTRAVNMTRQNIANSLAKYIEAVEDNIKNYTTQAMPDV